MTVYRSATGYPNTAPTAPRVPLPRPPVAGTPGPPGMHAAPGQRGGPGQRQPAGQRPAFRPDIEGLRAVAVLSVVVYHAGVLALGGGYVGVDVFFVISGFLITTNLYRELERTGRISFSGFYGRRMIRLLPASTLVVVATV